MAPSARSFIKEVIVTGMHAGFKHVGDLSWISHLAKVQSTVVLACISTLFSAFSMIKEKSNIIMNIK